MGQFNIAVNVQFAEHPVTVAVYRFRAEIERLESATKIQVVRIDIVGVRARDDAGGRLLVLRR